MNHHNNDFIQKIVAENESLKIQIEEYNNVIEDQLKKIDLLIFQLSAANEIKSRFDNQDEELDMLKSNIQQITHQSTKKEALMNDLDMQILQNKNAENELETLQHKYNHLESQFNDLQQQLMIMNNKNTLLQQQKNEISNLKL